MDATAKRPVDATREAMRARRIVHAPPGVARKQPQRIASFGLGPCRMTVVEPMRDERGGVEPRDTVLHRAQPRGCVARHRRFP